jgi:uncharacterized membrane protein
MEAMLGMSIYSYPYLQLAKNTLTFLLVLMLSQQQNWRRGQNRFCLETRAVAEIRRGWMVQGGEMAQTMYIPMDK